MKQAGALPELRAVFIEEALREAEERFETLIRRCDGCGTQFLSLRNHRRDRHFCSDRCRYSHRVQKVVDRLGVDIVNS